MSAQGNTRGAAHLVAQVAAVLSIGAGVVHISAAGGHTELPVLFTGFIVVAVLQLALGGMLLRRRPSRFLALAGLALMVGSIGAWLLSRTVGLPYLEGGHQEPVGFKDGVTVLFELGSIPALLLLLSRDLDRVSLPSPRLAGQTMRAMSAACCVLLAPALLLGGGEQHSHEEAVALGIHDESEGHGDSEDHELAQKDGKAQHEVATHDASGNRRKGQGHGRSSDTDGDGGHSGHTLASAPARSGHEHAGGSEPGGTPRHHTGGGGEGGDKGGGKHGDHPKGNGRSDGEHGGGHGGEDGQDGGGQGDEPPVSVSSEPLGVCVSGVCVP